jgi:hypothetical protein
VAAGSGSGGGVRPARQRATSSPPALGERKESEAAIEALSLSPLYNVESVGAVVGTAAAAVVAAFSHTALLVVGLVCRPGLLLESALLHSSGT